ncbi:hypothetical protein WMF27_20680 [Sorangium sp. So ce281]
MTPNQGPKVLKTLAGFLLKPSNLEVENGRRRLEGRDLGLHHGKGLLPLAHHGDQGVRGLGRGHDRLPEAADLCPKLPGLPLQLLNVGAVRRSSLGQPEAELSEGARDDVFGQNVLLDPPEDSGINRFDGAAEGAGTRPAVPVIAADVHLDRRIARPAVHYLHGAATDAAPREPAQKVLRERA